MPEPSNVADPEHLTVRIVRAFADVPYPGDDDLTASTYGDEPAALRRSFAGRTDWCELGGAFLERALDGGGGALAFFSDRALRFYLPAYLVADLRGQLSRDDPAIRLCAWVTPQAEGVRLARAWGGGTMGGRARATFALFDREQRACVVEYLRWKLRTDPADPLTIEQALDAFWLRDP